MNPEPWTLSDEQICAEVDHALVSKWMLSSERSERNRQQREREEALLERDPVRRRRRAEILYQAFRSFAEMWRQVVVTYDGQPPIGELLRTLPAPAPKPAALSGPRRPRQVRPELRPVHVAHLAQPRPHAPVATRLHRRQHR